MKKCLITLFIVIRFHHFFEESIVKGDKGQGDKGQVPVTDAIDKDYQFIVNDSVGARTQDLLI